MLTRIAIALSLFVIVAGCGEKAADPAPAATTTTEAPVKDANPVSGATASMAKCEACGAEVFADELKMDHGKMTCKKCVESHGH